ncbi:hypothetical protein KJS94_16400 [Flavihumibacter rivuli]|uniref:DUF7151 family protein n=1 Tax=Flavihumibacter rivuli TaxID=2838156 RepID=UPI001BDF4F75|nr:hypothetical protein [Flavihumibacter rivuli]ULQ56232.1 hypothetical protein KJS94_16400 [Flavihumibacter rivuli]
MRKKSIYFMIGIGVIVLGFAGCTKEGPAGRDGLNSLIKTSEESAGSNCAKGGLKVQTGLDINNNNILDESEIKTTDYLCIKSQDPAVYSAIISQSGTNAPEATIVKNDIGLSITWIRTAQGKFKGTIGTSLDLGKTIILCNNIQVVCRLSSPNEIILENTCGVNAWCDGFNNLSVEIKVYE